MRELKTISIIVFMLSFTSCYYDVEEMLYPSSECDTSSISYTNDIIPIISDNCYVCHDKEAKFGNVILDSHTELTKFTPDNRLIGVIKHSAGSIPMPQGAPKLLDCQIEKIEAWIDQGALNN